MIEVNKQRGEFSVMIIPDTQVMTEFHSPMFKIMSQWVIDHATELNTKVVLHLGDVVDDGERDLRQFDVAVEGLDMIHEANIPLTLVPGNHDYDNMLDDDRSLSLYNEYFGGHKMTGKPWHGGSYEHGKIENSFITLTINDVNYLFLSLEFGPRDEVLAWVDELLEQYPTHEVIVTTHCYMFIDGTRNKSGDAHNPEIYHGAEGANDGEQMWTKCFRKHRNIRAIYSGHQVPTNISYRFDQGDHGNLVFQSFQNWQDADHGGAGRLRVAGYRPDEGRVDHYVVNPQTNALETGGGYEVSYPLNVKTEQVDSWLEMKFP